MKVTSTKSIRFNKLNWGISAGEVKDLPEGKEAQARILAEHEITLVENEKDANLKSDGSHSRTQK